MTHDRAEHAVARLEGAQQVLVDPDVNLTLEQLERVARAMQTLERNVLSRVSEHERAIEQEAAITRAIRLREQREQSSA